MNSDELLIALKNGAGYAEWTADGYQFRGSFLSSSGYLKLQRLNASFTRFGALWGNTKVFEYWMDRHDR